MASIKEQMKKLASLGMTTKTVMKFVRDQRKLYNSVCMACKAHIISEGQKEKPSTDLNGFCQNCRPIVRKIYGKYCEVDK